MGRRVVAVLEAAGTVLTNKYAEGRVVDRRQALAEFGPGAALDAADQDTQHVVEDLDLILAEPVPVMQEKIRHLAKGVDASLG